SAQSAAGDFEPIKTGYENNKKGANLAACALVTPSDEWVLSGRGGLLLTCPLRRLFGGRGGFRLRLLCAGLSLRGRRLLRSGGAGAFHELHQRHRRRVTRPRVHAQDPGISARTSLEARPQVGEQLLDDFRVTESGESQPPVRIAIGLGERDERL